MTDDNPEPSDRAIWPNRETWDVIVVGSGMGGGAAGFALAELGHRVLLIEKGRSDAVHQGMLSASDDPEVKLKEGRWPSKMRMELDGRNTETWPLIGCGLGGSSIHYGAALGRLRREDFEPKALPGGDVIAWPFTYDQLEPFYAEAERRLDVCGTNDPLEADVDGELLDPPAMSDCDRHLFSSFASAKLHPYRLHLGLKRPPNCALCDRFCTLLCKSEVCNTFIEPARGGGNLDILDQAVVERLETDGDRVSGVRVRRQGDVRELSATFVVLAAGALFSPVIMINSTSDTYPNGIGNDADLVGRNLMFHAGDYLAVWPNGRFSRDGIPKALAFRDFYHHEDKKLGEVQSMGLIAGYGDILFFLQSQLELSAFGRIPLLRQLARIPAYIASKLFKEATVFSAMVEDHPYADNRVVADSEAPSGMRVQYRVREELRERVKLNRRLLRDRLSAHRVAFLNPRVELNYGHPCGTCRAGVSPEHSVVDADCQVHGVQNLYVADASVMPTSGGTNPSLTIAANALRVARIIGTRLETALQP